MDFSPCFGILVSPCTELHRLLQPLGAVIRLKTLQPFVLCVLAHVLDDIRSDIVDLVNGVYLDETSPPNLLQLILLDEREIAYHVIVNRSTLLELDDSNVSQLRVSVLQPLDELLEVSVALFHVADIEIDFAESQSDELAAAVKIHANKLPDSVSPFPLTIRIIMGIFDSGTVTVFFSFSSAGGIKSLVSPNLENPLCGNDFLVIPFQQNHPLHGGAERSVFRLIRNV